MLTSATQNNQFILLLPSVCGHVCAAVWMMHFSNGLNTNDHVPPSVLQEPDSLGLKNRGGKNNCKELESQSKGAKGRRRLRRRGEAKKKKITKMGRKKIQIARIMDERNRHVSVQKTSSLYRCCLINRKAAQYLVDLIKAAGIHSSHSNGTQ